MARVGSPPPQPHTSLSTESTTGFLTGHSSRVGTESAWLIAGLCALGACVLSFQLIFKHLRHYRRPSLQRPIVRIIAMVPLYAIHSWLSLEFIDYALIFDMIRDCYEAYVLYQFFSLLCAQLDGEEHLVPLLETKPMQSHPWGFCCLPNFKPGAHFFRLTKICVLQFVFIKPLVSGCALIFAGLGLYAEGSFRPDRAYLWLTLIGNASVSLALYYLVLFYRVTSVDLAPFKPLPKFLCVKAVVFFAYWQGVLVAALVMLNLIHGSRQYSAELVARGVQDFLICVESLFVAFAHHYAFQPPPSSSSSSSAHTHTLTHTNSNETPLRRVSVHTHERSASSSPPISRVSGVGSPRATHFYTPTRAVVSGGVSSGVGSGVSVQQQQQQQQQSQQQQSPAQRNLLIGLQHVIDVSDVVDDTISVLKPLPHTKLG